MLHNCIRTGPPFTAMQSYLLAIAVRAALEITEQKLTIRIVVGEVTESLHCLTPCSTCDISPASVAVEFLKVLDHGLNENFLSTLLVHPDVRGVQQDLFVDDSISMEIVDDFLSAANDLKFFIEVMAFKHRSGLELLGDTSLSISSSLCVGTLPDILESSRGKNIASEYFCFVRIISSRVRHFEKVVRFEVRGQTEKRGGSDVD